MKLRHHFETLPGAKYFAPGRVAKYCDACLCLSTHITWKPRGRTSPNLCACCLFPSLGPPLAALRCVFPVLWMTSCFHIIALWRVVYILKRLNKYDKHNSRDSNYILLNDKDQRVIVNYASRTELAIRLSCQWCDPRKVQAVNTDDKQTSLLILGIQQHWRTSARYN